MPKVSVIIPTHNRCNFLKTAIQSVLNQTYQDFELLVVNDASTDRTEEILYGFDDKRIKYIKHESNKGGAITRNTGIMEARGEYIAFLDDDDEWLPEKLGLQVALLDKKSIEVGGIYTGYERIERSSGHLIQQIIPIKRGELYNALLRENCIGTTSSVLLRRVCFDAVGLFDESLPRWQDYDMWIRIARKFHFDFVPQVLLKYYVHDKVRISDNPEAMQEAIKIMYRKYMDTSLVSRKIVSEHYLALGINYCYRGRMREGRKVILDAMKMYPFRLKYFLYFPLSFFGKIYFVNVNNLKEDLKRKMFGLNTS